MLAVVVGAGPLKGCGLALIDYRTDAQERYNVGHFLLHVSQVFRLVKTAFLL